MKNLQHARSRFGRSKPWALALGLTVFSCLLTSSGISLGPATASAAGPGEYSAPEWLPLREQAEVSCVMTNCDIDGPYHGYWALDLADPAASAGDPVFAAGSGQVRVVTTSPDGACGSTRPSNTLEVDHGGGVTTRYYHLASISVEGGTWVDRNTKIGVMGSSGFTLPCPPGGVHLHYEKRVDGANVDPGPLKACDGGTLKSYPEAPVTSWDDIPALEGHMVSSTGTDCEVARPTCTDVEVTVAQGASSPVNLSCSGESPAFEARSAPAHGTISNIDGGRLTYTPAADYSGSDSFTFGASNAGGISDPATVRITVTPAPVVAPPVVPPVVPPTTPPAPAVAPMPPATPPAPAVALMPVCFDKRATIVASEDQPVIVGTAGPDVIVGSAAAERIDGLGGNDTICAGGGDDVVRGGRGNDRLSGAADEDLLLGGTGNDVLLGGSGDDRTGGGSGWDYVNAGGGNDLLDERKLGGGSRDRLFGGSGVDRVRTNDNTADVIDCGADDDVLVKDGRIDQHRSCERTRRT